ncbi:MAG: metallophosphoesterase [Patescibacteria group bacterium]|jgi:hypothetical protein
MKRLNLEISLETVILFDLTLSFLAVLGLVFLIYGLITGHKWISYAMLACECILLYAIFVAPKRITISKYKEALTKYPKHWIRVVLIADIHANKKTDQARVDKIAERAKGLNPDVLLLGGDFVLWNSEDVAWLKPISQIKAAGKYFVLGNHDYLDDPQKISDQLKEWGLVNITNTGLSFRHEGAELRIYGLDDTQMGLSILPSADAQLILAHSPDSALCLKEGSGLVLCGHTHGGQIRLPLFGCISIPSKLGRRADQGTKIIDGVKLLISRGLGVVGPPVRLLCPPEILFLEIGLD